MKFSPKRPILDSQSGDSGEFHHVSSDHCQVVGQRDCRNLEVVWPDHTAPAFEVVADPRIDICATIIERKRNEFARQALDKHFPFDRICIFFRPNEQLSQDRRTTTHFGEVLAAESIKQDVFSSLQNLDPHVAIKKVSHFHSSVGGSASSSGRSNSISAIHPMNSASSGILRLISSSVGGFCGSTAEEIASRTRISNVCAASGSKRSKTRSSSKAIPLTHRRYDLSHSISIHNL